MALVLMVALVSATAGLGVLALIEVPLAAGVAASVLIERRIRRKRALARGARRRPVPERTGSPRVTRVPQRARQR
jgi:hypothetical protein